ncbi:MAG: hypothetical protein K2N77_09550 [Lachnospiraceae bacterium]|nr:hypothetical protein [Lachnospiraceae bacterium]
MIQLVIMIIICVTIYKRVQRVKGEGNLKGNSSLPNTTVTTANQNKTFGLSDENPYEQKKPHGGMPAANNAGRPQPRTTQAPAKSAIEEAKEDGNSTTAYLMEKAEADAREHAKEKFEEQKRLHETRGGLAVATRYLDGDAIPKGMRCVNCGYCGAANLVPMVPRTRYICYFCREAL